MNKQELINKLQKLLTTPSEIECYDFDFDDGYDFGVEHAITLAEQLDEPEKPVVPKFVADWYEEHKDNFEYSVQCLCVHCPDQVRQIDTWFNDDGNKPIETLVMMHKFGYEIEKEKLYTVELPNPNSFDFVSFILLRNNEGKIYISSNFFNRETWRSAEKAQLTEAEIKQDFDWAWEFAEEVE